MSRALAEGWLGVAGKYGEIAAALAADLFDVQAREIGVTPRVQMAESVNDRQAMSNLGYSLSAIDQLGNAMVALDLLVKKPYRQTMQNSAWASGAAWARVPSGSKTCAFCLMLASRGAVYHTSQSAGEGHAYHGDCHCVPALVRDDRDFPEGYDPAALYDQYDVAASSALGQAPRSGKEATSQVLAQLRQQQGIH